MKPVCELSRPKGVAGGGDRRLGEAARETSAWPFFTGLLVCCFAALSSFWSGD